jgi:hypothetical protein
MCVWCTCSWKAVDLNYSPTKIPFTGMHGPACISSVLHSFSNFLIMN